MIFLSQGTRTLCFSVLSNLEDFDFHGKLNFFEIPCVCKEVKEHFIPNADLQYLGTTFYIKLFLKLLTELPTPGLKQNRFFIVFKMLYRSSVFMTFQGFQAYHFPQNT